MLRLLMVTPRYFPYMGGIETHVYEVGQRLAARGISITLLTTVAHTHAHPFVKEQMIEGMRVIRVPAWPTEHDYYIAPEIYSIVAHGQWDLVHCQGCHTFVPPLAMLAAQNAHIPYFVTFHTGGHSSPVRTSIRGVQWRLLRPLFAHAAKLIGVSQFEADYFRDLLHLPDRQFAVIPNGASFSYLPSLSTDILTHPLIISVGRLERYKGHHRLIAALPKIRAYRSDARLLILGAGPYKATLIKMAREFGVAEHVEIRSISAENRQLMMETLSQASLVALLSEYEAHPIAVMEALALQRPVLVADTSGMRELAEKKLVRAIPLRSTSQEIAAATIDQIENRPASIQLDLPTWEDCAQKLHTFYSEIGRREPCVS